MTKKGFSPMASNVTLVRGMMLMSPNGQYTAKMQTDGNFVVWYGSQTSGVAMWATHTAGNPGCYFKFGSDGNLVVYNASNAVLWTSSVGNYSGSTQMSLQM
jgi:hypothetical protein